MLEANWGQQVIGNQELADKVNNCRAYICDSKVSDDNPAYKLVHNGYINQVHELLSILEDIATPPLTEDEIKQYNDSHLKKMYERGVLRAFEVARSIREKV